MNEQGKPHAAERLDEPIEDLDVAPEQAEDVVGGDKAAPKLSLACATGKHIAKAQITL